jgi:hypothetical protein
MKYAILDANGLPMAFYSDDIHENIPVDAIEITDEQWFECINNQGARQFVNGELVKLLTKAPTQEQLIQEAKSTVYTLLDQTAKQYDYRNFAEVAQFVNSNMWKAEADGLLAWQDAVWVKAYELLKAPITSINDFMAQLPKYVPSSGA